MTSTSKRSKVSPCATMKRRIKNQIKNVSLLEPKGNYYWIEAVQRVEFPHSAFRYSRISWRVERRCLLSCHCLADARAPTDFDSPGDLRLPLGMGHAQLSPRPLEHSTRVRGQGAKSCSHIYIAGCTIYGQTFWQTTAYSVGFSGGDDAGGWGGENGYWCFKWVTFFSLHVAPWMAFILWRQGVASCWKNRRHKSSSLRSPKALWRGFPRALWEKLSTGQKEKSLYC